MLAALARQVCIIALLALFASTATRQASADVLGEYLFWNEIGKVSGQAAKSFADYQRERQLWRDKIAAAKDEMARCGNCPAARSELEKWQKVENQFQDVAGSLAASVGMPRIVADFLGISMPLAPGRSPAERARECAIEAAPWAASQPPSCQRAVNAHLSCLRNYEQANGYCSWRAAAGRGADCWDSGKLFRLCADQDLPGFQREEGAQALRRQHPTVPEYVDYERQKFVLYPNPPEGFLPPLPPAALVQQLFEDTDMRGVFLFMRKQRAGNLRGLTINRFSWIDVAPNVTCYTLNAPKDELSVRICEDLSEFGARYRLFVISCRYSDRHRDPPDAYYWYGERPAAADPKVLLQRAAAHPLLAVQDGRTNCPATLEEARSLEWDYKRRLAALGIAQVPASVALPRSQWLAEQQRKFEERRRARKAELLAAFPIAGHYAFSSSRLRGLRTEQLVNAQCEIRALGTSHFRVLCKDRQQTFTGTAAIEDDGLVVAWSPDLKVVYNASPDFRTMLSGVPVDDPGGGYGEVLNRLGTYSIDQVAGMVAAFAFVGKYDLELTRQGATSTLHCTVKRNAQYRPNSFPTVCLTADGRSFQGDGIPDHRDPLTLRFNSWFPGRLPIGDNHTISGLHFPLNLDGSNEAAVPMLIGAAEKGVLARFVRADARPAALSFGTPLEELREFNQKEIGLARSRGIISIEQLAELSDDKAADLGVGWVLRRDLARRYLKGRGPGSGKKP